MLSNRVRYDVIEFSNYLTEERSEAEFFVQFVNEMASYSALYLNESQLAMFYNIVTYRVMS